MPVTPCCRHFGNAAILAALISGMAAGAADEKPIELRERLTTASQYRVSCRAEIAGSMVPPPEKGGTLSKPLDVRGDSIVEYDERVLALDNEGIVQKTLRMCRRTDFRRTVGGRPQETSLRPAVSRLVILRRDHKEVPFSPDGPLTWGEIDLIRTDVFTPALAGLLPSQSVRPGETWTASDSAVRELTDLDRIDEGKIECRLDTVMKLEGRRIARVAMLGTVRGPNEDGPNRQRLEGYFYFDLESNYLNYLYLKGIHTMLDREGKEVGRVEGRFVLTRQMNGNYPELSDEVLQKIAVEPNAENTLLLFDNSELGLRFNYARRWRVTAVRGNQVALDGADGSGLQITIDPPGRGPTAARFQAESRDWLTREKAKLTREEPPRRLRAEPLLEQFALEGEMGGKSFLMDFYFANQAAGSATLAARLPPGDLAAVRLDLEKLARSVEVTKPSPTGK